MSKDITEQFRLLHWYEISPVAPPPLIDAVQAKVSAGQPKPSTVNHMLIINSDFNNKCLPSYYIILLCFRFYLLIY